MQLNYAYLKYVVFNVFQLLINFESNLSYESLFFLGFGTCCHDLDISLFKVVDLKIGNYAFTFRLCLARPRN